MTHSSHRITYSKSLAGKSMVRSLQPNCVVSFFKKNFCKAFLPSIYASMKTCAQPARSEPAQTAPGSAYTLTSA